MEQRKANPRMCKEKDKEKHAHPLAHLSRCRNRKYQAPQRVEERGEECTVSPQPALAPQATCTPTFKGQQQWSREHDLKGRTQCQEVPRKAEMKAKGEAKALLETRSPS